MQTFTLANNSSTPIGWWLDRPLPELRDWIETNNEYIEGTKE